MTNSNILAGGHLTEQLFQAIKFTRRANKATNGGEAAFESFSTTLSNKPLEPVTRMQSFGEAMIYDSLCFKRQASFRRRTGLR